MVKPKEVTIVYEGQENNYKNFYDANIKVKELSLRHDGEKIDFRITYEDGYKYLGKFTINASERAFHDLLEHHMYGKVKWLAGLATNPACGAEEYKKYLEREDVAPNIGHYLDFLKKYQIGDEPAHMKLKPDKASTINEVKSLVIYNKVCIDKEQEKIKGSETRISKLEDYNLGLNAVLNKTDVKFTDGDELLKTLRGLCKAVDKQNASYNKGVVFAAKKIFNIDLSKTTEATM